MACSCNATDCTTSSFLEVELLENRCWSAESVAEKCRMYGCTCQIRTLDTRGVSPISSEETIRHELQARRGKLENKEFTQSTSAPEPIRRGGILKRALPKTAKRLPPAGTRRGCSERRQSWHLPSASKMSAGFRASCTSLQRS